MLALHLSYHMHCMSSLSTDTINACSVTIDLRIGGTIIRTILHHVPQLCAMICIHIVHWLNWEWVVCLGAGLLYSDGRLFKIHVLEIHIHIYRTQ